MQGKIRSDLKFSDQLATRLVSVVILRGNLETRQLQGRLSCQLGNITSYLLATPTQSYSTTRRYQLELIAWLFFKTTSHLTSTRSILSIALSVRLHVGCNKQRSPLIMCRRLTPETPLLYYFRSLINSLGDSSQHFVSSPSLVVYRDPMVTSCDKGHCTVGTYCSFPRSIQSVYDTVQHLIASSLLFQNEHQPR